MMVEGDFGPGKEPRIGKLGRPATIIRRLGTREICA